MDNMEISGTQEESLRDQNLPKKILCALLMKINTSII